MLTALLDFSFPQDTNQIKASIVKYELAIDRYEGASREEFPDRFKKATLVRAMPKEIKTHIHLSMTDKDTYASVKSLIVDYINVSRDFSQQGVADMDIDAVYRGGWKGRGRGRGSGGRKGNRKGSSGRKGGGGKGNTSKDSKKIEGECW